MTTLYEDVKALRDTYEAALETHVSPAGAEVIPVVVKDLTTILERNEAKIETAIADFLRKDVPEPDPMTPTCSHCGGVGHTIGAHF